MKQLKERLAIEIFDKAIFKLHKWHSNVPELELEEIPLSPASGDTFAKEHLEVKSSQSALLGLLLEKKHNLIRVPDTIQESTTD